MEVVEVRRRGLEVWRVRRHAGREVWRRGRVERDSKLWRCSKLWRRQEALEVVEISGGGWKWSKALEAVEGFGDSRKLWRWSKAPEEAM